MPPPPSLLRRGTAAAAALALQPRLPPRHPPSNPQAQGDPEFVIENVLALVLIGLAALALGNVLLKLVIVAYSLISAAVRYTVVGVMLIAVLVGCLPGRWWF